MSLAPCLREARSQAHPHGSKQNSGAELERSSQPKLAFRAMRFASRETGLVSPWFAQARPISDWREPWVSEEGALPPARITQSTDN